MHGGWPLFHFLNLTSVPKCFEKKPNQTISGHLLKCRKCHFHPGFFLNWSLCYLYCCIAFVFSLLFRCSLFSHYAFADADWKIRKLGISLSGKITEYVYIYIFFFAYTHTFGSPPVQRVITHILTSKKRAMQSWSFTWTLPFLIAARGFQSENFRFWYVATVLLGLMLGT